MAFIGNRKLNLLRMNCRFEKIKLFYCMNIIQNVEHEILNPHKYKYIK